MCRISSRKETLTYALRRRRIYIPAPRSRPQRKTKSILGMPEAEVLSCDVSCVCGCSAILSVILRVCPEPLISMCDAHKGTWTFRTLRGEPSKAGHMGSWTKDLWPHSRSRILGFPGGSGDKESTFNAGESGWIPGWGISSGGGHGHPLQYSGELPGEFRRQRSLAGYSPCGRSRLSDQHSFTLPGRSDHVPSRVPAFSRLGRSPGFWEVEGSGNVAFMISVGGTPLSVVCFSVKSDTPFAYWK